MIENVLAARYASPQMIEVWDPATKVRLERELWLAVLEAQIDLGLEVDRSVLADYRSRIGDVDLDSIAQRERTLRHDVKARLEEFNALAGHESIHLGMTSRDLTENVEQLQVKRALDLVLVRSVAALLAMARLATEYSSLAITARTHNVPAQVTTVGKRVATSGEELATAVERLERIFEGLALRGIKGPVGSHQDQSELLGSAEAAMELDRRIATRLGFSSTVGSVGQVYPRSYDFEVVAGLVQLVSGPVNLTNTLRLMAGHDLASEGFREGQVGSSAMPHKMNARTSERVHGLKVVLGGHLAMAAALAGEQWNEGDVSCSVVRRVMLPDAFFAADGLLQGFLTVLDEVGFFPAVIEAELDANLPFLATTNLLVAAVREGMGREDAHEVIKRHAISAARDRREDPAGAVGLLSRLAADDTFPLDRTEIEAIVAEPRRFIGRAADQVAVFVETAGRIAARHPAAVEYRPGPIL
jgi:adenylosuccinate lyase